MATISGCYIPAEILSKIVYYSLSDEEITGRGVGVVTDLCLVGRAWHEATVSQFARAPQKKKRERGNGKIIRIPRAAAATVGAVASNGIAEAATGAESSTGTDLLEPAWEDEVMLKDGRLRIGEVVVWHDLQHATQCLQLNRENMRFWASIRAIFISVVRTFTNHYNPDLRLAHGVFATLHDIFESMRSHDTEPKLQWLRLSLFVWQGLENIDAPGMFYLGQLYNIPFVRFHGVPGKSLNCYVSKAVREVITARTGRVRRHAWAPTGLEDPCRADWRVQALRRKRRLESKDECFLRFLVQKYDSMYNKI